MSFKPSDDHDKPRKTVHDSMPSSGFMPISTVDAFDSNQKPFAGLVQKNTTFDKQGRNHYVMTSHGLQQIDAYPVHRSQEVKMFPVSNQSNQTIKVSMSSPHIQSHLGSNGQNHISKIMNQQFVTPISVLPPQSSVVGTTDSRNASKPSDAPTQLTIFYAGSVCVYEDITPEKAQISRPFVADTRFAKSHASISSPISTTSHVVSQYGGGASSSTNELTTSISKGALASPATPKVVNSARTSATHLVSAVAVPQARKASLARFLEKRKERVMSTSPYNVSKISPDGSIPESECLSLSVNSAGSSHFHPINQERNLT
jgi:jasmonate ZIM domain-containing protein